jgi:hypothetical protein
MRKIVIAVLVVSMMCAAGVVSAQDPTKDEVVEQQIKLLRQDLRAEKKKIVAANMQLTEAEAVKFWPVYDAYTVETTKLNDTLQALVKEYAQNYDTMTDEKIKTLTESTLQMDEDVVELRMKYVPLFEKAIAAKKTARFFQIDRRLEMLVNLQLSSGIPLVQP